LDLEGFEVVEAVRDSLAKCWRLTVVPTTLAELCPHCNRVTGERHACHDRIIVDLPLGGWQTELVARLFQFKCESCEKFFTPRHRSLAEGAHATERFLERLAQWATHGDLSTAARFLGVAQKTAEDWYYKHLKRLEQQPRDPAKTSKPIESLGIDELSLKKGTGSSAVC
jgi:transposase